MTSNDIWPCDYTLDDCRYPGGCFCREIARLRAELDEATRLLGISAERFRFYESQYRNKLTADGDRKGERIAEQAAEIEAFLAKHKEAGADE